jgi:hypothetical protein
MGESKGISLILICSERADLRLLSSESQGATRYHQYGMRGGSYLYYEDRWYVGAVSVYV